MKLSHDRPEEQVLVVINVEVPRVLLHIGIAKLGRLDADLVVRELWMLQQFIYDCKEWLSDALSQSRGLLRSTHSSFHPEL